MNEIEELNKQYLAMYDNYKSKLIQIDEELDNIGRYRSSIVIKKIKGNLYYYEQWREDGKIKSRCIGKMLPGIIADTEERIKRREELLKKYAEITRIMTHLNRNINDTQREDLYELEDYSFEVFWKNELSARVSAKGKNVHVSRYIIHPVKQLFSTDYISRNQLNMVLKLRCFEEGRSDVPEILKYLGLKNYVPLDIVRKTHGVSYNDYIWFRFPGEKITAEDVLVR